MLKVKLILNKCGNLIMKNGKEIQWSPFSFPMIIREIFMIRFEWFN
ncbi:hypothetical protein BCE_4520 [Bacillus cereus ATCC 10987]|uniref:Uncharacterized protein n=1 Tax=Bacillus cereus (strain ATCC 10987 / NRS 248) TaxID=222523 RepID=Q72ZZ7_BACC1|nr:hypothetical protein BCE_4520 [Bacillus cereus ATCC 10987]